MIKGDSLDRGRDAFLRQAWADAFDHLLAADREGLLGPEDLERLAVAAYLVGRDADSVDSWVRANHGFLGRGDVPKAARCAFWLGFVLVNKGEMARASGWFARGQRLLDEDLGDCVERGYFLVPVALQNLYKGEAATAYAIFGQAAEIGYRFHDSDLVALARLGRGQALIQIGEIAQGTVLLDEVMVGVTAGEVSTIAVGTVYCAVIETCQKILDLRRAQEWTAALSRWCEAHPDMVPYRGQCLVFRAEIMRLHGAWQDALEEANKARARLSQPQGQPALGAAFYQLAELYRLRGEFTKAEDAYRQANQWGRKPQPGLARMRLAQGQVDAAETAIRRVANEAMDRRTRAEVLSAYVEIALATGNIPAAHAAAAELSGISATLDTPLLRAVAAYAQGAVLLAEGNAQAALEALLYAWTAWCELEVPYEAARVRVLVGMACRKVGDDDTAEMEFDAARKVFQQLGALPDLARMEELSRTATPKGAGGLTAREVQVLRLVASGKTNRTIAAELFISEKTVARHVSNIFTKLGLSTRAAAAAYAYEHDLV